MPAVSAGHLDRTTAGRGGNLCGRCGAEPWPAAGGGCALDTDGERMSLRRHRGSGRRLPPTGDRSRTPRRVDGGWWARGRPCGGACLGSSAGARSFVTRPRPRPPGRRRVRCRQAGRRPRRRRMTGWHGPRPPRAGRRRALRAPWLMTPAARVLGFGQHVRSSGQAVAGLP
jgi:hypothetical protein